MRIERRNEDETGDTDKDGEKGEADDDDDDG